MRMKKILKIGFDPNFGPNPGFDYWRDWVKMRINPKTDKREYAYSLDGPYGPLKENNQSF